MKPGELTAFIPNPPTEVFQAPHIHGHMEVIAVSISENEADWVRGWEFNLFNGEKELVEQRYVDESEFPKLRDLLRKHSDAAAPMGYQYQSVEGIIFKVFHANQRITMLTALGARIGLEGDNLAEEIVTFMQNSAKLWE